MSTHPTQEQNEQAEVWYLNRHDMTNAVLTDRDRDDIADLAAYHAHALAEREKAMNEPVRLLGEYLRENPVASKEAWDAIAKKADDDFGAFKAGLAPEARQTILEENAERTLRDHFHNSPTLADLERMSLENSVRQVYQENKKLKSDAHASRSYGMSREEVSAEAMKAEVADRIKEEHRKYAKHADMEWHVIAAGKVISTIQETLLSAKERPFTVEPFVEGSRALYRVVGPSRNVRQSWSEMAMQDDADRMNDAYECGRLSEIIKQSSTADSK